MSGGGTFDYSLSRAAYKTDTPDPNHPHAMSKSSNPLIHKATRMNTHFIPLCLLLASLLARGVVADEISPRHTFWKVSSQAGTVYLLGSIHFGRADMYPLPSVISSAFEESDVLVVEVNILDIDPIQLAQTVSRSGMYSDGSTLKDHVQPSTWQTLSEVANRYGVPPEIFQPQRPWLAALTITTLELTRLGYSEQLGIDRHFLMQANTRKPIVQLESLEQQLALFGNLSEEDQDRMLQQTLQDITEGDEYFQNMIDAWRQGSASTIDNLLNGSFESTPELEHLYELLITDRNIEMTTKIEDLLKGQKTYFVVLGAGHMVGDQGVVNFLTRRGYEVTQL